MKFFGKEVSDTGCEILIKVGSRFADPTHDKHATSWRDGQIIDIRPLGFHIGKQVGYCCTLLKFPNIDYAIIGGRWEKDWKVMPAVATLWDKINHTINTDGKYKWEVIRGTEFEGVRSTRDWFFDFKDFSNKNLINKGDLKNIYDFGHKTIISVPQIYSFDGLLKNEDQDARLDPTRLHKHASITSGTHSIGSGLDYDTVTAFEAAIGATLTGNLTGEHNNEETAISSQVAFVLGTATYLLKLTAQSGDEHNGGAYGNGARITYGTTDQIRIDSDSIDDAEISNLALDCRGSANEGINLDNCTGLVVNRNLIYGDVNTYYGITTSKNADGSLITNNIVYDIGEAGTECGIALFGFYSSSVWGVYNNTVINCYNGIGRRDSDPDPVATIKNNLVQASRSVDYYDAGGGFGTTGHNISEDATSPDVAYRSKDVHTNSVFQGYATDDFRLDSAGDATNLAILDDGEDLSGTFTDDIEGQIRSTWYIGASEIVAAGGTNYPRTVTGALPAQNGGLHRKLQAERTIEGAI